MSKLKRSIYLQCILIEPGSSKYIILENVNSVTTNVWPIYWTYHLVYSHIPYLHMNDTVNTMKLMQFIPAEALHHDLMAARMTGGTTIEFSTWETVPYSCHGCHQVMVQSFYSLSQLLISIHLIEAVKFTSALDKKSKKVPLSSDPNHQSETRYHQKDETSNRRLFVHVHFQV